MIDLLWIALIGMAGGAIGSALGTRYLTPRMGPWLEAREQKRWRKCGAECGRKLPPEMFAEGALNCRDCVAVRLLADDLMRERTRAMLATEGPVNAMKVLMLDDNHWDECVHEARKRLGVS
jgi:hypothetical protein